jgi:hypothetical protein
MAIIAKEADYVLVSEGSHNAVYVDIVELGIVSTQFGDKLMVSAIWQTDELTEAGKPATVSKRYNLSLHPDSNLRHDIETALGRKLTKEESKGFDVESLIDVPCLITVVHNTTPRGTFANVENRLSAAQRHDAPEAFRLHPGAGPQRGRCVRT